MKIVNVNWGRCRIIIQEIFTLVIAYPLFAFPQQGTPATEMMAVNKIGYHSQLRLPDRSEEFVENPIQDTTKQAPTINSQDTTALHVPEPKPDYSKLELKIEINQGEQFTRSREVILNFSAPEAREMRLGKSADISDGKWQPFQSVVLWTLSEADGFQRIYFQVRYPDSTLSNIVFDEIILDSTPPVIKFHFTPDRGIAGETSFDFDATESTDDLELSLRWDWEDDGKFDTEWSSARQKVYCYCSGGGKKTVRLEIKNDAGWVVSATKELVVYSRPEPQFSYIQDFIEPLKITLDASRSNDFEDGNLLQYRWNLNADSLWEIDWSPNKTVTAIFLPFTDQFVTLEVKDTQGFTSLLQKKVVNEFAEMVYIPAGNFLMGHDDFEIDERPTHEVSVDEYWIDKYPVTNRRFVDFLNEYLQKYPERKSDIAQFIDLNETDSKIRLVSEIYRVDEIDSNHPVIFVTWTGADAYCRFYDKRLPTEAEWENAARGNDKRLYAWGDSLSNTRANYWDSGDPFESGTTPVGFYNGQNYNGFQTMDSPSFFGAYDMGGNVKEWISDWYVRNYYSQSPGANPRGPQTGVRKVVRGGGYLFHSQESRSTYRYSMQPDRSTNFVGFRCVKSRENHSPK